MGVLSTDFTRARTHVTFPIPLQAPSIPSLAVHGEARMWQAAVSDRVVLRPRIPCVDVRTNPLIASRRIASHHRGTAPCTVSASCPDPKTDRSRPCVERYDPPRGCVGHLLRTCPRLHSRGHEPSTTRRTDTATGTPWPLPSTYGWHRTCRGHIVPASVPLPSVVVLATSSFLQQCS